MLVSVITVCFNSESTIEETIRSVQTQTYGEIEHIIVDGMSTDNTPDVINRTRDESTIVIRERDDGIYDAMNKGLAAARGDVVAILNSDDLYADERTIETVVSVFLDTPSLDAILTDIRFFKTVLGSTERIFTRFVKAKWFRPNRLAYGWMPPHSGIFLKREVHLKLGNYDTSYKICGDYELVVRCFKKHSSHYKVLDFCSVFMREGGVSTRNLQSNLEITAEIVSACRQNGVPAFFSIVLLRLPIKWFLVLLGYR